MIVFWLAVAVICARFVASMLGSLRLSGSDELTRNWRHYVLPGWIDGAAILVIMLSFWSQNAGAQTALLVTSTMIIGFLSAVSLLMARAQMFAWVLLWHKVREHREHTTGADEPKA